jgi:hypothetical protein
MTSHGAWRQTGPVASIISLSPGREASTEYKPSWLGNGFSSHCTVYRTVQCTPQSTHISRDETGSVYLPQCPLSWSVHCNFSGEGKCNERGWACTPHPHQPRLILPSSLNVRQKAAFGSGSVLVANLNLWIRIRIRKKLIRIQNPACKHLQCQNRNL